MTSLDASALEIDPQGLGFLAAALDMPAGAGPLPGAFDPAAIRPGWAIAGGAPRAERGLDARDERCAEPA